MQGKKCFYQFLTGVISLFILGCGNEGDLKNSVNKKSYNDSLDFWISKSNAPDINTYRSNLQKVLEVIELEKNDTLKSKYSLDLSYAYYQLDDSVNFIRVNQMAKTLAMKVNDSSKLAAAYWDAAGFYDSRDKIDSSYYAYAQAHKIYQKLGNDYNASRMLYSMARALGAIKDYTTAETYTVASIALLKGLEHVNKNNKLYNCYNFLGMIANNLKEYDKALEYHNQALSYLKISEDRETYLSKSENNIGSVHRNQGNYSDALQYFGRVIRTDSLFFKDVDLYAKALSNAGYCHFKLGDKEQAETQIKKAIKIQDSINDNRSLSRSYHHLAELYLTENDTSASFQYANLAKDKALSSDNNLRVLETLGLLTQIDPKNATAYSQEYIQLNDSLQTVERRARNKFERIRFETNETIAENVLLSKKNQMWAAIAGVFLLLGIATYVIISQRRKNEQLRFQEEQQESNQRIHNLLLSEKNKIEEGKKLAQKRISEELHDAVQSRLQGIRMLLLGLNKRNTPEAIEERGEAIKELKGVQEEVRAISHELSNAAYEKVYSFISSVQELLKETEKNTGLQSNFHFDETVDWDHLDSDIKINSYRIIQESIQNCVKYAEAQRVELTFALGADEMFQVTIADDGKGFRIKSSKKGIGMRNINSRVEKLGGTWEIQSKIGEGTKVILYIPTSKPDNPPVTPEMKIA